MSWHSWVIDVLAVLNYPLELGSFADRYSEALETSVNFFS